MVLRKNILVTGSNGQLGSSIREISNYYDYNFFFKKKEELDITNFSLINRFLLKNNISSIINCAAYTDVYNAEKNKIFCENVNHFAVDNIAKLCLTYGIQLIHISTDYVFEGSNNLPYNEQNKTNPKNFYGKTKLMAENKILGYPLNKSIIIRTSWLYSKLQNNFVNKIINKIKNETEIFVVDDEVGSPTNSNDLAKTIMDILPRISNDKTEIYHYSNLGLCSRYQLAKKIRDILDFDCSIYPIKQNLTKLKRPSFSALDSSKMINNFQIKIDTWENSLEYYLKNHHKLLL